MTAVHHPAPINQFYRLDRDTPTGPLVKVGRWNHTHADATGRVINWDGLLCMAGEGAVALDAQTGGTKRASPGRIHDYQDDRMGGIGVTDVDAAFHRGYGEDLLTPDWYNWLDIIYAVRVQRRHAVIGVDYDYVTYEYRVQKEGSFDHAIGVDDVRATDSRIFRYDTLDTKAVWTPQSAYRAAAEALALRVRGTKERLFVGLTKSRPIITPVVRYEARITGYTPLYSAPGGTRLGAVSAASYTVIREKHDGLWWYRILTKLNGQPTANVGRWFKPNRNTRFEYA